MSIYSELYFDHDQCERCGCVLYENIASKHRRYERRRLFSEDMNLIIYDIECSQCGHVNEILYFGQPVSEFGFALQAEFWCVQAI